jgi:hypothetical protein
MIEGFLNLYLTHTHKKKLFLFLGSRTKGARGGVEERERYFFHNLLQTETNPGNVRASEQGCQMMVYFRTKKSQFGYSLKGLGIKNVGIFYDHGEYFNAIWYI